MWENFGDLWQLIYWVEYKLGAFFNCLLDWHEDSFWQKKKIEKAYDAQHDLYNIGINIKWQMSGRSLLVKLTGCVRKITVFSEELFICVGGRWERRNFSCGFWV